MQITDPVADMLTRIRNANSAKHETVDVPASNLKKAIAQILLEEGYIKAYSVVDNGNQGGATSPITTPHPTATTGRTAPSAPTRCRSSTWALRCNTSPRWGC